MIAGIADVARDVRGSWKQLFLTDVVYKVIAFVLLTPLVSVLFRLMLSASGNTVLTDQDILFFFAAPLGWLCLIAIGGLWIGIVAVELAALMAILATPTDQHLGWLGGLRFASSNAWRISRVTARMVALTLLSTLPFLAVAAAVYFSLLSEFDINYYLQQKPPRFLIALGIGVVLAGLLAAWMLRLFTGWFFALPLVLFEGISPSQALRVSRERASGHRRRLLAWMLGWLLATALVSVMTSAVVVALGRILVSKSTGSLGLMVVAIGASLLVWAVVTLIVNLLSTTTFASIHFNLYRSLGRDGKSDLLPWMVTSAGADRSGFRLTRRRLMVAGVVGVVAVLAIGIVTVGGVRLDSDVDVIAHRGASQAAPENTMASIKQAIEDGADWVEIDVQETADGTVVVFHDSDFMKLAGLNLKIWDATMADLKEIDIGGWFGDEFKDQRVPTLADVLDQCRGKVGVNIELKYYGHDVQLEQRVVEIVERHQMTENIVLMSLKIGAVDKMRALRPDWKVGLLMSVAAGNLDVIDADFLAVNASFASRSFISRSHESGKDVFVWTVNDAVTMSTMIGRGVDGLITDKPALARTVLEQLAEMSAAERLMLELASTFGVAADIGEQ